MVQPFWSEVQNWLVTRRVELPPLTVKLIRFGVCLDNKDCEFVINFLLCFGKFFIHKCRWFKSKPNFNHWLNEVKLVQFSKII